MRTTSEMNIKIVFFRCRSPEFSEKLIRYCNAIINLNYLSITGEIQSSHWESLEECGMLKSEVRDINDTIVSLTHTPSPFF